ncbi:MAG: hypothetical protein GH151_03550 [Bacteroidetes bacterium]|nr:hypothetical protein [Bacteroidota bacterium]
MKLIKLLVLFTLIFFNQKANSQNHLKWAETTPMGWMSFASFELPLMRTKFGAMQK